METNTNNSSSLKKVLKAVVIAAIVIVGLAIASMFASRMGINPSGLDQANNLSFSNETLNAPSAGSGSVALGRPVAAPSPNVAEKGIAMDNSLSAPTDTTASPDDKKIIKNGNFDFKVNSVDQAMVNITQIAKDNGGDIFSSNIYQSAKNIKTGYATVKVPAANFEKTYSDLKKVATLVISESTSGADVTEQYTDLQAQLKNAQAEEQAYLNIMNQAQKVSDILEVQQQLSRVQGEIESLQGRIKFMDSQINMAAITISLTEDANVTVVEGWRPLQVAKEAINNLVVSVQNFIDFVIRFIIIILPIFILYAILVWVIYIIGKKIYNKFSKKVQV
jgi:hypothetical protein